MYKLNSSTLIISPTKEGNSIILENHEQIQINEPVMRIIDENCKYYGSSYNGRLSGTKKILGISYKAPIIVEESSETVFFPTTSPRLFECEWLSLKNVIDYQKYGKNTIVTFNNNEKHIIKMSYKSFDNQILRAARLQMLLKSRKLSSFI